MPVKMEDVAQHVGSNRSLRGSVETVIESVISAFRGVSNAEQRDAVIADMEANRVALADSVFAGVEGSTVGRRLGPGETPTLAGDDAALLGLHPRERADRAEAMGNPVLPRDASGHKVHPADAFSGADRIPADRTATSFGGTGAGVDASNRTAAALAARNEPAAQGVAGDKTEAEYKAAAERGIAAQRAREQAAQKNGPVV